MKDSLTSTFKDSPGDVERGSSTASINKLCCCWETLVRLAQGCCTTKAAIRTIEIPIRLLGYNALSYQNHGNSNKSLQHFWEIRVAAIKK
jgi:hypothetical protein